MIALQKSTRVKVHDDTGRVVEFGVAVAVDGLHMQGPADGDTYLGPLPWHEAYAACCQKAVTSRKRMR